MTGLNKCFPSFLFPNQWYRPGRFWEVGDSSALDAGRSSEEEECCRWELHQGFGQSHGEMVLTRKYAQCCKTRVLLVVVPFSRWFYKLMRLHHLRFWIWLDVVFSWFKMPHSPQLRLQWLRLAYRTWPEYWQELVIVGYVGAQVHKMTVTLVLWLFFFGNVSAMLNQRSSHLKSQFFGWDLR